MRFSVPKVLKTTMTECQQRSIVQLGHVVGTALGDGFTETQLFVGGEEPKSPTAHLFPCIAGADRERQLSAFCP
jgi:hypothetical protein